jgi:hypothetical protein
VRFDDVTANVTWTDLLKTVRLVPERVVAFQWQESVYASVACVNWSRNALGPWVVNPMNSHEGGV